MLCLLWDFLSNAKKKTKKKNTNDPRMWSFTSVGLFSFSSKSNKMHQCLNLFYFWKTLYMFRTVFPSIIRRSRLYIQQQAHVKQNCWLLAASCWIYYRNIIRCTAIWTSDKSVGLSVTCRCAFRRCAVHISVGLSAQLISCSYSSISMPAPVQGFELSNCPNCTHACVNVPLLGYCVTVK